MRTTIRSLSFSFIVVGGLVLTGSPGCKKAPPPPPPAKGSGGMAQGGSGQAGGAVGRAGLQGEILETMDSGGYTYLKLKTAKGEVWAAVRKAAVSKGQRVTVVGAQPMKDFESRTLKRTFPLIYFGQLGKGGQAARPMNPHGSNPHAGRTGDGRKKRGTAREAFDKPLPKATGANARTVAEVYAQRKELAGKTVVLRGKVVRYSRNIMGKNWLHLQDGTGKTDDFDLTVTTQATAKAGDVVLVEGTVKADVNLGAGYSYKVLVEKATVKPGQ